MWGSCLDHDLNKPAEENLNEIYGEMWLLDDTKDLLMVSWNEVYVFKESSTVKWGWKDMFGICFKILQQLKKKGGEGDR